MRHILVGCGRWGSALARRLTQRGHQVTVIDRDPAAFERLGPAFPGHTVTGIGFDREVLEQAGIARADGLAAVTASDEANVVAARIARQVFRVPQVVARLCDPRQAEMYRRLGLATINPVDWGTGRVAEYLCRSGMDPVLSLGGGEVDVVQLEVPHLLIGRPLSELTVAGEVQVVALQRDGRAWLPALGAKLQAGDRLYLAVLTASIDRLKALLGQL